MIEAIDPGLAIWLITLNRPQVVRFAIVVPSQALDDVNLVTDLHQAFPALGVEVIVAQVDPLDQFHWSGESQKERR